MVADDAGRLAVVVVARKRKEELDDDIMLPSGVAISPKNGPIHKIHDRPSKVVSGLTESGSATRCVSSPVRSSPIANHSIRSPPVPPSMMASRRNDFQKPPVHSLVRLLGEGGRTKEKG